LNEQLSRPSLLQCSMQEHWQLCSCSRYCWEVDKLEAAIQLLPRPRTTTKNNNDVHVVSKRRWEPQWRIYLAIVYRWHRASTQSRVWCSDVSFVFIHLHKCISPAINISFKLCARPRTPCTLY